MTPLPWPLLVTLSEDENFFRVLLLADFGEWEQRRLVTLRRSLELGQALGFEPGAYRAPCRLLFARHQVERGGWAADDLFADPGAL